jgi:nitrite reductase (NADH) small subunit/3-phenylpropionate/trans-cinnamate dioxygenase ferredoxin subunit
MNDFTRVAHLRDLPPGTCRTVDVKGTFIALFNINGMIYALDNTCPHAGGPLGEGALVGDCVQCPWHGWRFHVPSGTRRDNPEIEVTRCEVRVDGEEILVSVPPLPR